MWAGREEGGLKDSTKDEETLVLCLSCRSTRHVHSITRRNCLGKRIMIILNISSTDHFGNYVIIKQQKITIFHQVHSL